MNTPTTMTAARLERHGAPLRLVSIATPTPTPGQVLVRIGAAGLNPLDAKIRAGQAGHARHPLPAILGIDMAGTVVAIGAGVERFRPGDEVFAMSGGVGGVQGSLAEFAAVDAELLALKPAGLSMREAAALPLTFITAWEGLVDRARVRPGQKVLVHGGAGGVGRMAVQLALARGARVFATGSAGQRGDIERLGAVAIDYRSTPVGEYVAACTGGEGFDIVYDTVGGAVLDASFEAVRRYLGHVVSSLGWGTHALAPLSFRGASYSGVFTLLPLLTGQGRAHHGEILREAATLAAQGRLRARLDGHSFALAQAEQAYRRLESGAADGKIVVDVSG